MKLKNKKFQLEQSKGKLTRDGSESELTEVHLVLEKGSSAEGWDTDFSTMRVNKRKLWLVFCPGLPFSLPTRFAVVTSSQEESRETQSPSPVLTGSTIRKSDTGPAF